MAGWGGMNEPGEVHVRLGQAGWTGYYPKKKGARYPVRDRGRTVRLTACEAGGAGSNPAAGISKHAGYFASFKPGGGAAWVRVLRRGSATAGRPGFESCRKVPPGPGSTAKFRKDQGFGQKNGHGSAGKFAFCALETALDWLRPGGFFHMQGVAPGVLQPYSFRQEARKARSLRDGLFEIGSVTDTPAY